MIGMTPPRSGAVPPQRPLPEQIRLPRGQLSGHDVRLGYLRAETGNLCLCAARHRERTARPGHLYGRRICAIILAISRTLKCEAAIPRPSSLSASTMRDRPATSPARRVATPDRRNISSTFPNAIPAESRFDTQARFVLEEVIPFVERPLPGDANAGGPHDDGLFERRVLGRDHGRRAIPTFSATSLGCPSAGNLPLRRPPGSVATASTSAPDDWKSAVSSRGRTRPPRGRGARART